MSLLQRISPASPPPTIAQKGDLAILKERVLQTLLIILCLSGIPSVVLAAYEEAAQGNYSLVALYIGFYLLFLGILFAQLMLITNSLERLAD